MARGSIMLLASGFGRLASVGVSLVVLSGQVGGQVGDGEAAAARIALSGAEPSVVDTLIAELDSPAWRDREVASAALVISEDVGLSTLVERLARGEGLSPEQRFRLWSAAETRFVGMPAPGLGVAFNPGRAVTLNRVLDNFPASEVLRAGDE
ncbi:MAG: hypothetical protein AAF235_04865, partial [Planctomycetota bacterium]